MGNSLCLCRALSIYEFKSDRLLAASLDFEVNLRAELEIMRLHEKIDQRIQQRLDQILERLPEQPPQA